MELDRQWLGTSVLCLAVRDWVRQGYPRRGVLGEFLLGEVAPLRELWCAAAGLDGEVVRRRCQAIAARSSGPGTMRTTRPRRRTRRAPDAAA